MDRKTELTREYIRRTHDGRIDQCKGKEYGKHDICAVCNFKLYCEDHTAYAKKSQPEASKQATDRILSSADVEAIADKVIEKVQDMLADILQDAQIFELGGLPDDFNEQS